MSEGSKSNLPEPINSQYGRVLKRSTMCEICTSKRHIEINLMRARDHMTLEEISIETKIHPNVLKKHFENHFYISEANQKILELKENTVSSYKEIVTKALEGDLDFLTGGDAILKSKAERLNIIKNRILKLSDALEHGTLDEEETKEFLDLNKEASNIENSMLKTYQAIDKKLFPPTKEDLFDAVTFYKLDSLKKMLNKVALVFIQFEEIPEYQELVQSMREVLAVEFNRLEDEVIKSGGVLRPPEKKQD